MRREREREREEREEEIKGEKTDFAVKPTDHRRLLCYLLYEIEEFKVFVLCVAYFVPSLA